MPNKYYKVYINVFMTGMGQLLGDFHQPAGEFVEQTRAFYAGFKLLWVGHAAAGP